MTIVKNTIKSSFFVAPNDIFEHNLSTDALALYCYLASKPDNWIAYNQDIKTALCIKSDEKIAKVWKELSEAGWIVKSQNRDENSKKLTGGSDIILLTEKTGFGKNPDSEKNRIQEKSEYGKNPDTEKIQIQEKTGFGKKPDSEKIGIRINNNILNNNYLLNNNNILNNTENKIIKKEILKEKNNVEASSTRDREDLFFEPGGNLFEDTPEKIPEETHNDFFLGSNHTHESEATNTPNQTLATTDHTSPDDKESPTNNVDVTKKEFVNEWFEEFWKAYIPVESNGRIVPKGSKKIAFNKYKKKLSDGFKHEDILSGLNGYLSTCKKNGILTCGAPVFLNQERWVDYVAISPKPVEPKPQPVKSQFSLGALSRFPWETVIKLDDYVRGYFDANGEYAWHMSETVTEHFNRFVADNKSAYNAPNRNNLYAFLAKAHKAGYLTDTILDTNKYSTTDIEKAVMYRGQGHLYCNFMKEFIKYCRYNV